MNRRSRHVLRLSTALLIAALVSGCSEEPGPAVDGSWISRFELRGTVGETPLFTVNLTGLVREPDGTLLVVEGGGTLVRLDAGGRLLERRELEILPRDGGRRSLFQLTRAPDGTYRALTNRRELAILSPDLALIRLVGPLEADGTVLDGLNDLAVGPAGETAILDVRNFRVITVDPEGAVQAFGRRCADECGFEDPKKIAIAPDGSIFVSDQELDRVVRFSGSGEWLGSIVVEPTAHDGRLPGPGAIAFDHAGDLRVVFGYPQSVGRYRIDGTYQDGFTLRSPGSSGGSYFGAQNPLVFTPLGDFFVVALYERAQILHFSASGDLIERFGGTSSIGPIMDVPGDVLPLPDGGVYLLDARYGRVCAYDARGVYQREWNRPDGAYWKPGVLDVGSGGSLVTANETGTRIHIERPGNPVPEYVDLEWPPGMSVDGLVAAPEGGYLLAYDRYPPASVLSRFGAAGDLLWSVSLPDEVKDRVDRIRMDAHGNSWVFNSSSNVAYGYDPRGDFLRRVTLTGPPPGRVLQANDFVIDASGDFLVSDNAVQRVFRFDRYGHFIERFALPGQDGSLSNGCAPEAMALLGDRFYVIHCGRVLWYQRGASTP